MLGFKRDSKVVAYGRFGIGPLVFGAAGLWLAVRAVLQFPDEDSAWYALTMSATMTGCGLGSILYGLWLDWRQKRRSK